MTQGCGEGLKDVKGELYELLNSQISYYEPIQTITNYSPEKILTSAESIITYLHLIGGSIWFHKTCQSKSTSTGTLTFTNSNLIIIQLTCLQSGGKIRAHFYRILFSRRRILKRHNFANFVNSFGGHRWCDRSVGRSVRHFPTEKRGKI